MLKTFVIYCCLIIGILFTGITFGELGPELQCFCTTFENVEIDNYRVLIQTNSEIFEPIEKQCIECGKTYKIPIDFSQDSQKVFLLDKSININDITEDNLGENAIYLGPINLRSESWSYNENKKIKDTEKIYKISKKGNNYTMELAWIGYYMNKHKIEFMSKDFLFFRSLFIVMRMVILFLISKFFWKENKITSKKIILGGIIPTTIIFPLLYFHLPGLAWRGLWFLIIGEIFTLALESIIIKYLLGISRRRATIISVLYNLSSFIVLYYYTNKFYFAF